MMHKIIKNKSHKIIKVNKLFSQVSILNKIMKITVKNLIEKIIVKLVENYIK